MGPGTRLGRYEIVQLLGEGGMGAVFEARHMDLEKRVAVKVLLPEISSEPEVRRRFLREGQAASRIHHPNAVDVTDVGAAPLCPGGDPVPYLVMEYLEGRTLARLLEAEGRLPVERLADIMLPVLAAVAAAHREGIIHRDLKPENIFLARTRDGVEQPKVLDFGISKMKTLTGQARLTLTATVLGTPLYMSPEQVRGAAGVDRASDIWSLGVILYESSTGVLPFVGDTPYQVMCAIDHGQGFPPPRARNPGIPASFEAVVLRAMQHDPARRHASVDDLARALLPFASQAQCSAWAPVFMTGPGPTRVDVVAGDPMDAVTVRVRRRPWAWLIAAAVSIACGSGLLLVARPGRPTVPAPAPRRPLATVAAPAALVPGPVTAEVADASVFRATPARTARDGPRRPRAGVVRVRPTEAPSATNALPLLH